MSVHKLNEIIEKQQQINAQLIERNHTYAADVSDLKHGNDAIAERARNDLGMIKQGEVFYQIVPSNQAVEHS